MMEEPAPLINPAPVVHRKRASTRSSALQKSRQDAEEDENVRDPFDAEEVFEHIKDINDPEHPYSLEQVSESLWIVPVRAPHRSCVRLRSRRPAPRPNAAVRRSAATFLPQGYDMQRSCEQATTRLVSLLLLLLLLLL